MSLFHKRKEPVFDKLLETPLFPDVTENVFFNKKKGAIPFILSEYQSWIKDTGNEMPPVLFFLGVHKEYGEELWSYWGSCIYTEQSILEELKEKIMNFPRNKDLTDFSVKLFTYDDVTIKWDQVEEKKKNWKGDSQEEENSDDQGENNLRTSIKNWMEATSFADFENDLKKRVIGQEGLSTVLGSVYYYLNSIANGGSNKCNVIITAPSGTGKTKTFRSLRQYFQKYVPDLVISQIDLSQITSEGFKGKDTKYMVLPLLENANQNGIGIIFLDEFDKRLVPATTTDGDDVNKAIQSQILTVVEGNMFSASIGKEIRTINTENTLFIALGSFDEIRRRRGEISKREIKGFGSPGEKKEILHYEPITKEDMIELGGIYELLGRFPLVINYQKLSREAAILIIDKIRKEIGNGFGMPIEISKDYQEKLIASVNTEYGCRQITSMIYESAIPAFVRAMKTRNSSPYEIYLNENGNGCLREVTSEKPMKAVQVSLEGEKEAEYES